jgi:parallel beta-helix repeat protein
MKLFCFSFLLFIALSHLNAQKNGIALEKGLVITRSCAVKALKYGIAGAKTDVFAPPADLSKIKPAITITGENVTVDFQNAVLDGGASGQLPNTFCGAGILIKGKNITLKNARIRGYKVAILALDAENLRLENCDVSHNYRPQLRSVREHEDFSDWLSYHNNEKDEWLRYGAGIYLKNCQKSLIKNCTAVGNQNALLINGCNEGLIYNNTFQFNSGLGIGLYRSSRNRLMHNRLDWNVRGYSHGIYQRGQDSAGLLLYEQSSGNLVAFNSATHSGDGFFLWAGQSTMDTGLGGCNDNWVYGNDFSHAPTNGVEITFSRNRIQGNYIDECTYGIWGGYSFDTHISGNLISNCRTGVAIEHGQNDTIQRNLFEGDSTGIQLRAREKQPADWGYAQKRDTRSRDCLIDRNVFLNVRKPLEISASEKVSVNGENLFSGFETLLEVDRPNTGLKFFRNDVYADSATIDQVWRHSEIGASRKVNFSYPGQKPRNPYKPLDISTSDLKEPDSLPDGIRANLPEGHPRGRRFILVDEWGPYDFKRPIAHLKAVSGDRYTISFFGPVGEWRLAESRGIAVFSTRDGLFPEEIECIRAPGEAIVDIAFEYRGKLPVITQFGDTLPADEPVLFFFRRFENKIDWRVQFFNLDEKDLGALQKGTLSLKNREKPDAEKNVRDLWFAWWGKPAENIQEDRFATRSSADFDLIPGEYTLTLTSDDGARLYVDGKRLIDRWTAHEPETGEITVRLGGSHRIEIEHYDATGFSTLDFKIKPK